MMNFWVILLQMHSAFEINAALRMLAEEKDKRIVELQSKCPLSRAHDYEECYQRTVHLLLAQCLCMQCDITVAMYLPVWTCVLRVREDCYAELVEQQENVIRDAFQKASASEEVSCIVHVRDESELRIV